MTRLAFADDRLQTPPNTPLNPEIWRVLVVDDEMDVHQATALALRGLEVEGRSLQLLHAHSASEAFDMLLQYRDIAAILLDVVMESDQAGLFLVRRIREELEDDAVRIILRTGQSGLVPQIDTIRAFEINDYKTKSELTRTGLFTCLSAAIRSYKQIRELKDTKEDLEEQGLELIRSRNKLRALTAYREKVREDERKHIARELHDDMGQYLTALRIETSMLEMLFPERSSDVCKRLHTMRELIDHAIAETRRIVSNLRPVALDLGLISAAEWLTSDFQSRTGIPCRLRSPEQGELDLDQEVATTLFRILQESLTNVSRHAAAKQVDIRITRANALLQLEVSDDGCGFDPAVVKAKKTFGLMGIRERVLIYGGTARIDSSLGQGTRLLITLPLNAL